jgi:hypothetical protein
LDTTHTLLHEAVRFLAISRRHTTFSSCQNTGVIQQKPYEEEESSILNWFIRTCGEAGETPFSSLEHTAESKHSAVPKPFVLCYTLPFYCLDYQREHTRE